MLKWLSFDKSTVAARCVSQGRILLCYYWATYCILKARQPRYLAVKEAKEQQAAVEEQEQQGQQQQEGKAASGARA